MHQFDPPPAPSGGPMLDEHGRIIGVGNDPDLALDPDATMIDRELSWMAFNERVLALSSDPTIPLLERLRFSTIFASNLDEFVQIRVAGLVEQVRSGVSSPAPSGLTPREQLTRVRSVISRTQQRHAQMFNDDLLPQLAEADIEVAEWTDLSRHERSEVDAIFESRIFPVLTPLAVDPSHPFPYLSNLSLNLAVSVRRPGQTREQFARVKIPPILDRLIQISDRRWVLLEDVIANRLDRLFDGMEVIRHDLFRVTRSADFRVEESEADDLLETIRSELTRARFGSVTRLEITRDFDPTTLALLRKELGVESEAVVMVDGPLDLTGLAPLCAVGVPELQWPPHTRQIPRRLVTNDQSEARTGAIFDEIRRGPLLVHHPYESFSNSVLRFIKDATADPQVLAIKQTLYRLGEQSELIDALVAAAESSKQIVVLVELLARFDESNNIRWARRLEKAGVHVVYGVAGLKTHSKATLVVRLESDGTVMRYAHIGTGNYNGRTASMYEDVSILTADQAVCADLSRLFNSITGHALQDDYHAIVTAPRSYRRRLAGLINEQIQLGEHGRIAAKMNALTDPAVIDQLYRASQAGVQIDLVVRGLCALRPGVDGLSENIRVRSLLGRFLEHSRIMRFGATDPTYLIGSGDWMTRNLDRRIEVMLQVESADLKRRLDEILDTCLQDHAMTWSLEPDGTWTRNIDPSSDHAQQRLIEAAATRNAPRVTR